MKRTLTIAALGAASLLGVFAAPAAGATSAEAVSENWAGYEVASNSANGFHAVSGAWIQPSAKCTANAASYSAFWVGIGGGSNDSTALEQTGTQADCTASGRTSYFAWYELVPSAPVELPLKVEPGDHVYGRVTVNGRKVRILVIDKTTGQSASRSLSMTRTAPDTSTAEWVAEAPSQCSSNLAQCTPLPLADFSKVTFTNAYATAGGHTGPIGDRAWTAQPIELSPSTTQYSSYEGTAGNVAGAAPSGLGGGGSAFSVSWSDAQSQGQDPEVIYVYQPGGWVAYVY